MARARSPTRGTRTSSTRSTTEATGSSSSPPRDRATNAVPASHWSPRPLTLPAAPAVRSAVREGVQCGAVRGWARGRRTRTARASVAGGLGRLGDGGGAVLLGAAAAPARARRRVRHFFFEAEGGIREVAVTGVQTCALPI